MVKQTNLQDMGVDLRSADERPPSDLRPEDIRLAGGEPGYHVFLPDSQADFIDPFDAQTAKSDFERAFRENPNEVAAWQGKTREEIRRTLGLEDVGKAA